MQIVLAVLEIFLPELMSVLSGPASVPLAGRFRRVGYGLIGLAGSVRELDLLPQPSLRYPLLVFVDAMPITFQR